MKQIFQVTVLVSLMASGAFATNVGLSISVGDPNFYGRLDINNSPPPRVIYAQPVVVEREHVVYEPVYLRVPPGHEKHWAKHCAEYHACNRRVYFVQDGWYTNEYAPRHGHGGGHGKGHGHGKEK